MKHQIGLEFCLRPAIKNDTPSKNICLFSYNSRGFSDLKREFCRSLLTQYSPDDHIAILGCQEHFLLKANIHKIYQSLPDHHIIIKPAVKGNFVNGRAKGGLFLAFPNNVSKNVEDVSPDHWRVQASLLNVGEGEKLLLVNTYFPVDSGNAAVDPADLHETLSVVSDVIEKHKSNRIIFFGDINCDFSRQSFHVSTINRFVSSKSLMKSWSSFSVDFTYSFHSEDKISTSIIDHFFWDEDIDSAISEAGVIHLPDNLSDHDPVYCIIKTSSNEAAVDEHNHEKKKDPNPSWKDASEEQRVNFQQKLYDSLIVIDTTNEAFSCNDVKCKNEEHLDTLDDAIGDVLSLIELSANSMLIKESSVNKQRTNKKSTPGWNEDIKKYKTEASFWLNVWVSAGRPVDSVLHSIMKRTRNLYHFMIRKCKRAKDTIVKSKVLDSCLNGNGNLFKEIKKLRKVRSKFATSMDGKTEGIPAHFSDIYSKLYNEAEDHVETIKLEEEINKRISNEELCEANKIDASVVKEAAKKLKCEKGDPHFNFTSDCIKNSPDLLFEILSVIIRSFVIHGHVSVFLLLSTLVPIIKNKLSTPNLSKNYRSVAISSLVLKLIDWIILILYEDSLSFHNLQFAYQESSSTTMCTWGAIETIGFFLRNGSSVFTCLMDNSKAFDKVRFSVLFRKLLGSSLPVIFCRILLFSYMNQSANVRWKSNITESFTVRNGVKQGMILSGVLYCFYTKELFDILEANGYGCWVEGVFCGVCGYSDDTYLVAPSLDALQNMISTCEKYAESHHLVFSTDPNPEKCKTKCIAFSRKKINLPPMILCGDELPWVTEGMHLGHLVTDSYDGMKGDVIMKRGQYIQRNCELIQEFNFCHPRTKFKINQIYNSHMTGSQLWNLFSRPVEMLLNSWNVSIRQMFGLNMKTHRYIIEPISGRHLKSILKKRFLKFIEKVRHSRKSTLSHILKFVESDCRSTTGHNLRNILLLTQKNKISELDTMDAMSIQYHPIEEHDFWRINQIEELLEIIHWSSEIPGFDTSEIKDILDFICTS